MSIINPGVYFRELYPQYSGAARICELVYDNIHRLFKSYHDAGGAAATIVTLGGNIEIIMCRCLLGYYKPTIGGDRDDVIRSYKEFLDFMKDHGLEHHFSSSELSDAEHFFVSANLTMVPLLGLAINPVACILWDYVKPMLSAYKNEIPKTVPLDDNYGIGSLHRRVLDDMRSDLDQLTGPDLAGHHYGIYLTYFVNAEYYLTETLR